MSETGPPNLSCWGIKEAGKLGYRRNFELAPKTVRGTLLRIARGREFEIAGAATAKLREPHMCIQGKQTTMIQTMAR